jgi:hypothetical protein
MTGYVGATSWVDTVRHIRVYSGSSVDNEITEQCFDFDVGKWYAGSFSESGAAVSATSWVDDAGKSHMRVYVATAGNIYGPITEYCWDTGSDWVEGMFQSQTGATGEVASAISWPGQGAPYIRVFVADAGGAVTQYCLDPGSTWYVSSDLSASERSA